MNYSLINKVVAVTGGANGIGLKIADKYLEQEAKVAIILDLNEDEGKTSAELLTKKHGAGKIEFMKCDVTTDLETVFKSIFHKHKAIDVLVLNAGIQDTSKPRKMIDVMATSVIEWSLKFIELTGKENGGNGGTIVINSSIFGFRTTPYAPIYQAAKFAVLGFAKSIGHEFNFKKSGVRVLAICPGFTRTNLTRHLYDCELIKSLSEDMATLANTSIWQDVDVVGDAAVTIFEKGKSGTAWVVEGGELTEHI